MRTLLIFMILVLPGTAQATLIERLMGWPGFEKIAVHTFFAVQHEFAESRMTRQDVIDYLQLTPSDISEYDQLTGKRPVGPTALAMARKGMFTSTNHSVFLLAEVRAPGYSTPAEVRAKLGLP